MIVPGKHPSPGARPGGIMENLPAGENPESNIITPTKDAAITIKTKGTIKLFINYI
jgi:hypothetical protein